VELRIWARPQVQGEVLKRILSKSVVNSGTWDHELLTMY